MFDELYFLTLLEISLLNIMVEQEIKSDGGARGDHWDMQLLLMNVKQKKSDAQWKISPGK